MRHLLAVVALSSLAGCFNPDAPVCAFSCGPGGLCPPDYFCASDNYCHKNGYTAACPGYSDASVPDLGMPVDMSMDMTTPDMVTNPTDGSMPDLFTVDMVPSCTNLVKDPLETDVDCGGSCVSQGKTCADGKMCLAPTDCSNGFCAPNNICFPAHCNNGSLDTTLDGGLMETDVDCGGPCPKCANTLMCNGNADCVSGNCISGRCRPFQNLTPCATPGSYSTPGNTITFPGGGTPTYSVSCLRISRATNNMVTWNADSGVDFSMHPLNPSTRGTGGNPIMLTNTAITSQAFTFTTDGFYPFFCGVHGDNNGGGTMSGVIQVVP